MQGKRSLSFKSVQLPGGVTSRRQGCQHCSARRLHMLLMVVTWRLLMQRIGLGLDMNFLLQQRVVLALLSANHLVHILPLLLNNV